MSEIRSTALEARSEAVAGTVSEAGANEADAFAALLKQSINPTRSEARASEVDRAFDTLIAEALENADLVGSDVYETLGAMIARIDEALSTQINAIIHHPTFQEIESAWRGLEYLVTHSETDANLKLKVMNVGKLELYRELESYRGARWDQSPLFKELYEAEFGQLGGQPYGALIGDYYFEKSPTDIALLRHLGKIASASHCPFVASAGPALLDMESWNELSKPRDISTVLDTPDFAAWKSLRDSENSRYLGLCMPRVLAREPYGAKSVPVEEFGFEEETDGHAGQKYAWMNAAYTYAANINRAFKDYGWTVRIRGVNSGGEVSDLPTHAFSTSDPDAGSGKMIDLKCPTEIAISDRREAELSKAGLLPLIHRKNTDKAAFIGAQSLYRPKAYDDAEATASDNLSSRLTYMFAVSRFAHYLKQMVRDHIGTYREQEKLQTWLQTWIYQYVDGDPRNSSEEAKAKRPLAEARVEVFPDEENPGYYGAKFHLRPHFQLEGMDIGLSLVSKLPKNEAA
ncbi:type VI secretion system contractile sheath large subunit [Aurantimonas sp. 22II-16-19i]|uniref:type VI secretion system contractile sheath large subunit n=1 Tax=Aurantimonas sp. 22II-16-19i TaxID=1317114 RepID=UPI0009F80018|nr:type VI secretion system contractile sheath large subunit [Aurantimonas sp. 22II-16-19i]ORE92839.1 EvpB family type VI secretion protein [Aurantimonas sp. 22II-16-19i]